MNAAVKKRAFEGWSDFRSQKIYFEKIWKTKVVSITFGLRFMNIVWK